MRLSLLFAVSCAGCSSISALPPTHYHSPLMTTNWQPLAPWPGNGDDSDHAARANDLRSRFVAVAREQESHARIEDSHGERDVEQLLDKLAPTVGWRAAEGVAGLVDLAAKRGAYSVDGQPSPGDIVLFHNTRDANQNGETDDWLSGCGVVLSVSGHRFLALVRTGHRPREVKVSPDGPSLRTSRGEVINSYLRVPSRDDQRDVVYLAGQLYAGHIDLEALVDTARR